MLGQMMDIPLMISSLLVHADRNHGDAEIVTRTVEGPIHRYTYREAHTRTRKAANMLKKLGIEHGDRVATLAWNTHRHFELYFSVSGVGAVIHTINPRLHPEQVAWIANHAGDRLMCFDTTFAPIIEKIAAECPKPSLISSTGQSLMKRARPACATPRAPPATPRACCIPIDPPSCTLGPANHPMA